MARCNHAAAERTHNIEVAKDGEVVTFGTMCDPCWDACWAEFEEQRAIFRGLIEQGIDRAEANRIMIDDVLPQYWARRDGVGHS